MRPTPALKRSRRFDPKPSRPSILPRLLRWVLMLAAAVLVVDAFFGDRGFVDTVRARQEYAALVADVERIRAENAALREEARLLKEDPAAVEAVAREQLGLIYPGETLFIVSDKTSTRLIR